jgi:hypothetical protein
MDELLYIAQVPVAACLLSEYVFIYQQFIVLAGVCLLILNPSCVIGPTGTTGAQMRYRITRRNGLDSVNYCWSISTSFTKKKYYETTYMLMLSIPFVMILFSFCWDYRSCIGVNPCRCKRQRSQPERADGIVSKPASYGA